MLRIGCGKMMFYVADLNVANFDDLSPDASALPRDMKNFDAKLYRGFLSQTKGTEHVAKSNAIRTGAIKGYG